MYSIKVNSNIDWSYRKETDEIIDNPQKYKCKIDPNHIVEKQYGKWGPHKCKIVCVDCGGKFILWVKDEKIMSPKESKKLFNKDSKENFLELEALSETDEDYWINQTEKYIKYAMDEDSEDIKNSLDDVLGIK